MKGNNGTGIAGTCVFLPNISRTLIFHNTLIRQLHQQQLKQKFNILLLLKGRYCVRFYIRLTKIRNMYLKFCGCGKYTMKYIDNNLLLL